MSHQLIRRIHTTGNGFDIEALIVKRDTGGFCAELRINGDLQMPCFHDDLPVLAERMSNIVIDRAHEIETSLFRKLGPVASVH